MSPVPKPKFITPGFRLQDGAKLLNMHIFENLYFWTLRRQNVCIIVMNIEPSIKIVKFMTHGFRFYYYVNKQAGCFLLNMPWIGVLGHMVKYLMIYVRNVCVLFLENVMHGALVTVKVHGPLRNLIILTQICVNYGHFRKDRN